jgi:peptidoglycan/LPS O-acetylase OafA/YrhL
MSVTTRPDRAARTEHTDRTERPDPAPPTRPDRPPADPEGHRGFRPDIEGLRALAVLAVLAFHAAVPHLAGGFVGVDLFFVISGFLITGLLLDEHRRTGRISFGEFYARRARRILPAAAVVLVAVTIASWQLLPPLRRVDVVRDVLASAGYAVNWRFIQGQTDYLAANRDPSPLLHYWSLAVEEQFYIVWPLLLVAVLAVARWLRARAAIVAGIAAAGVIAGSFALSLHWTATSAPWAYLSSPSRAWQFAAGAAVAALLRVRANRTEPGTTAALLGWVGLGLVAWSVLRFDTATVYPGWAAAVPTLGAMLLLGTGAAVGRSARFGPSVLLARRPVRWVGRLSYSLYLWHWPVLVLAQVRYPDLRWPQLALLTLASAVPAWLTMKLVEDPVRRSQAVASRSLRGLSVGVSALVLPLALALVVGSGAVVGMDRQATAAAAARADKLANLAVTGDPFRGGGTSGTVTPAAGQARHDAPHYPGQCILSSTQTRSPDCVVDPDDASPAAVTAKRVVLLGDSHAGQWYPVAAQIAKRRGWNVEVLNKTGCPLPDIRVTTSTLGRDFTECDTWRANTLRRLASEPTPRLVILAALDRYVSDPEAILAGWTRSMRQLESLKAPLVYLADSPFPGHDVPACVSGSLERWAACAMPRKDVLRTDYFADAVRAGRFANTSVVDLNRWVCPPGPTCPAVRDGVLMYRDDSHLTDTAVSLLAPNAEHTLTQRHVIPDSDNRSTS